MIEHFCIMTAGGVVLWSYNNQEQAVALAANSVDSLLSNVLIEDRVNERREHVVNDMKLKWLTSVEASLVYVVVFQRFMQFVSAEQFLREVRDAFEARAAKLCPAAKAGSSEKAAKSALYASVDFSAAFDEEFRNLLNKFDVLEQLNSGGANAAALLESVKNKDGSDNSATTAAAANSGSSSNPSGQPPRDGRGKGGGDNDSSATPSSPTSPTAPKKILVGRKGAVLATGANATAISDASPPAGNTTNGGKNPSKPKDARTWGKDGRAVSAAEAQKLEDQRAELEAKSSKPSAEQIEAAVQMYRSKFIKIDEKTGKEARVEETNWSEQVKERGMFQSWFRGVWGNVELDMQDLEKIVPKLKEKLVSKNVAVDVAERVCQSLLTSVQGKKVGTFQSSERVVEEALVESLRRIMRPNREINVLREVAEAKQRGKPYSIVFCGVNGVGKSTSLSKICYWLQQNGFSVLMAAGDTFRHGAVEQLQVHGRCLNVPVYQIGYGSDPTEVAKQAIQFAAKSKIDVVLVDTAGRMQDHEARMAALARLIGDNNPNLCLFVGEALVGNNGIDQLRKFNQCLRDYASLGAESRGIDGIVLTKFDTIDDKVGAAVSMVYQLGQPIVFVGVGQTYQDLKSLETDVIVDCLMK